MQIVLERLLARMPLLWTRQPRRGGRTFHRLLEWLQKAGLCTHHNAMPAIAAPTHKVRRLANALFIPPNTVQDFAAHAIQVLRRLVRSSPGSAHAVPRVLSPLLRHVRAIKFRRGAHGADHGFEPRNDATAEFRIKQALEVQAKSAIPVRLTV